MRKNRNQKPPRKMKPVFLVFCEGETEETYINFLRQQYRLPVKVIPYVTRLSISPSIIQRHIQAEKIGPSDKITSFLMYDLDREEIAVKIAACKNSISISSNPSVELWFLIHSSDQHASILTDRCITALRKAASEWVDYKKGFLSNKQKTVLWNSRIIASERAKLLPNGKNPSSSVYLLIAEMEKIRESGDGK